MLGIKSKSKGKHYTGKNPLEAIREEIAGIGSGVVDSVKGDLGAEGAQDLWSQLLKTEKKIHQLAGDIHEGEELDVKALEHAQKEAKARPEVAPGLDYGHEYTRDILHYQERASSLESHEVEQRVTEIMVELKRLVDTSAVLEAEFKEVTMNQAPVKAGKYHLNFFEWMLSVIRSARQKIEDSGSWLQALSSKKSKKNYWAMFKKHGTTFGLSNERVVATQTG